MSFGSYNAADLSAQQLQQYKLDAEALQSAGCQLQLVLFTWGANKPAKGDYLRYTACQRKLSRLLPSSMGCLLCRIEHTSVGAMNWSIISTANMTSCLHQHAASSVWTLLVCIWLLMLHGVCLLGRWTGGVDNAKQLQEWILTQVQEDQASTKQTWLMGVKFQFI